MISHEGTFALILYLLCRCIGVQCCVQKPITFGGSHLGQQKVICANHLHTESQDRRLLFSIQVYMFSL